MRKLRRSRRAERHYLLAPSRGFRVQEVRTEQDLVTARFASERRPATSGGEARCSRDSCCGSGSSSGWPEQCPVRAFKLEELSRHLDSDHRVWLTALSSRIIDVILCSSCAYFAKRSNVRLSVVARAAQSSSVQVTTSTPPLLQTTNSHAPQLDTAAAYPRSRI